MGRKIFAEKNYNIAECVIPYEDFKPFSDTDKGFSLNVEHRAAAIAAAEDLLIIFFSHGIYENAPGIHMPTATLKHCLEKISSLNMKCIGYDELP